MKLTKAQRALLDKAAANDGGLVFPFHGEWNTAYWLARNELLAVRIAPGKSQHYALTDAGRRALSSGDR